MSVSLPRNFIPEDLMYLMRHVKFAGTGDTIGRPKSVAGARLW
jgi:hypothetical protein